MVLLKLIPAIAARYLASRTSAEVILSDSATLHALFTPYFFGARNEKSFLACFDSKGQAPGRAPPQRGYPQRQRDQPAEDHHRGPGLERHRGGPGPNHPQRPWPPPSQEDLFLTRYIQDSLKPLGITLYDHVILTDDDMVSLRDSRYLTPL